MDKPPRLSPWFWIYSTGGIGRSPWAPGSMASAACALLWRLAPPAGLPLFLILLSAISVVGVVASEQAIRETGLKDPSVVVIDEWFGQGVALLAAPHSWWGAGLAFVFFRVFDILKPPPVSFLEQAPGGVGIMLDDLGAGLLAALLLHYFFLFLPASG
ncbi:MAG: phosphatidylglycerophosphatase A family protein [Leptospirillia bacterium]